ncbi:MAG TPA: pyruvate kinase [Candidatus Competibacter sp.]|nr:pyruvate kinase [Candidatus Competibacteraceae bacterium]HRE53465.1 pyruvate kinase [Candidatus Competibacter sp.]HUM94017.1 pyruvate kinase [Candidatus Competibacter sp.]
MSKIMKFTKIVATLGPNSRNPGVIEGLLREGADVIRLNFSHGAHEDHALSVRLIREVAQKLNRYIAIFQDLQGPKIRLGQLDGEFLEVATGDTLALTTDDLVGGFHDGVHRIAIDHRSLHEEVKAGDRILIDDGLFEMTVERVEGRDILTRVVNGGRLKPRKGVNLPNIKLKISAITDKDRADLQFAYDHGLDYVALSFVRDASDIKELIDFMLTHYGRKIPIIAKIEKPEAFKHIDGIIHVADAIMVARGDLGVETSPQEVPLMQKTIIRFCNIAGKPVITATQMLESMIANPRPTRAEANDVANAILDGTDAVMLSGETAVGQYPVAAVRMMKNIALSVEASDIFKSLMHKSVLSQEELMTKIGLKIDEAVHFATVDLTEKVRASYLIGFTNSGSSVLGMAKFRPVAPLIAFSPKLGILRKLALIWGVTPLQLGATITSVDDLLSAATEFLLNKGMVREGEIVVFSAGVPIGVSGGTNMIKVVKIEREN